MELYSNVDVLNYTITVPDLTQKAQVEHIPFIQDTEMTNEYNLINPSQPIQPMTKTDSELSTTNYIDSLVLSALNCLTMDTLEITTPTDTTTKFSRSIFKALDTLQQLDCVYLQ